MFGKQVANKPKTEQTIEGTTNILELLLISIQESNIVPFEEKKMPPQLKQYATAFNNIISAVNSKLAQQKQKKMEYDEKSMIQLLNLGFDKSSNFAQSIDNKLTDLNFKKHKKQAAELINHIGSLCKLQISLKNLCKIDTTQKIFPFMQSKINKIADYQREIIKISRIIQPQNGLQNIHKLKSIEAFVSTSKQATDHQEAFFVSIINNLIVEAYDAVLKNSQMFGDKLRQSLSKFVSSQQQNRKKSGQILTQLNNILPNVNQQPQSTKTNLNKIGQTIQKFCNFFSKLSENSCFIEHFKEAQKNYKPTLNILDKYLQAIAQIDKNYSKMITQCNKLKEDLKLKAQQSNRLSSFPKQCYLQLRMQKYPKTLHAANTQTSQMINRIKSLVILEGQYQKLNIQCADNQEKIKNYQKASQHNNTSKSKQLQAQIARLQHYQKEYKQLEQSYTQKVAQFGNLQNKIREIAGYKQIKPINSFIPLRQIGIQVCLEQIQKKLKKLNELENNISMKEQQFGHSNKILMNENKLLKQNKQQLHKQYQSLNNSTSALEKDNACLKQQLQRKQQQIKDLRLQIDTKNKKIQIIEDELKRLLQVKMKNQTSNKQLSRQKQNLQNKNPQKQKYIRLKDQKQNKDLLNNIQSQKQQQKQDLAKEMGFEYLDHQSKQDTNKSQIQTLRARIFNLQKQLLKQKQDLQQNINNLRSNQEKIGKKILQIFYQHETKDSIGISLIQGSNSHSNNNSTVGNQEQQNFNNLEKLQKRILQKNIQRKDKQDEAAKQIQSQKIIITKLYQQKNRLIKQNYVKLEEQIKRKQIFQNKLKEMQKIIDELQQKAKDKQEELISQHKNQSKNIDNSQNNRPNLFQIYTRTIEYNNQSFQIKDIKKNNIKLRQKLLSFFVELKKIADELKQLIKAFNQEIAQKQIFSSFLNIIEQIKICCNKKIENADKKNKQKLNKKEQDLRQHFQQESKQIILQKQLALMNLAMLEQKLKMMEKIQKKEKQQQQLYMINEQKRLSDQLSNYKQIQKQLQDTILSKNNQLKQKKEQIDQIIKQYTDFKKNTSKILLQISSLEKQKIILANKAQEILRYHEIESKIELLQKYQGFITRKIQPNLSFILHLSKLFQGKLMENEVQHKFAILSHLSKISTQPPLKTQLLFKYDKINDKSFHRYIDNQSNILCIAKTAKGVYLACYYSGVYANVPNKPMTEPALLINLSSNQSYVLKTPQVKQTTVIKSMIYDDYFLIFGNAEFRIKSQEDTIFSNFGVMGGYFNNRGHKIDKFLCEGNDRQTKMQGYEIYKLFFVQQERERNE